MSKLGLEKKLLINLFSHNLIQYYDDIAKAASKDMALYQKMLDVFWRRVNIMEQLSGRTFSDMPEKYREK